MKLEILNKDNVVDIKQYQLYIIEFNNIQTIGFINNVWDGISIDIYYFNKDENKFEYEWYDDFIESGGKIIQKVEELIVK